MVGEFSDGEIVRLDFAGHILHGAKVEILSDCHGARSRVSERMGQPMVGIRASKQRNVADFWMPVAMLRKAGTE